MRLSVKRTIKSGLIGGKKFEIFAKVVSDQDLVAVFKPYADEPVLAYKSGFSDKPIALRRSELLKGYKFAAPSMNELIEFEDNLKLAIQHIKRMLEIIETGDGEVFIEP